MGAQTCDNEVIRAWQCIERAYPEIKSTTLDEEVTIGGERIPQGTLVVFHLRSQGGSRAKTLGTFFCRGSQVSVMKDGTIRRVSVSTTRTLLDLPPKKKKVKFNGDPVEELA